MTTKDPHQLRANLQDYLRRLLEQTEAAENRTQRNGVPDPMKTARGQTALESAAVEAQAILRSLDRILETPVPEVITFRTTCNGLSRLPNPQCTWGNRAG